MEGFLSLFGGAGGAGGAATSAATTAAESAALAQSGATAASVTAAGQGAIAAQTAAGATTYGGLTAGQWAQLGSNVLQTGSQIGQNISSADQAKTLASASLAQARQEEFVDRKKSASLIAKQKAAGAAAGLDISSGTPNELLLDSAYNAELNALNIRKQGRFNADYYKTQARRSKAQIPGLLFGGLLKGVADYGGYNEYSSLLKKLKGP